MTRIKPHEQHIGNKAAMAMPRQDIRNSMGYCPVPTSDIQLLPLRYGLIEPHETRQQAPAPYALKARPVGLRLMRSGYLYVLNHTTDQLHEYCIEEGSITDAPPMVFPRNSVLYVNFSQTQWSLKKCAQVTDSPADRLHFMQRIDLGTAPFLEGGEHLYTRSMVEQWLPEVAHYGLPTADQRPATHEDPSDAVPAHETRPYLWESSLRFRDTHIGEFIGQVLDPYIDNVLFMAVHDDLGIMQDLAHYQDVVLQWMDDWARGGDSEGANQRDYLLASYIQSLSLIAPDDLDVLLHATQDPGIQVMAQALAQLPDSERENARQALATVINDPQSKSPTPSLKAAWQTYQGQLEEVRRHPQTEPIVTLERQSLLKFYPALNALPKAFFDAHSRAIWALRTEHSKRLNDQLYGANLGQRGINELIDRNAMDVEFAGHSAHLKRWNDVLALITADRVYLLTHDHFHKAAWYYDFSDQTQCHAAFVNQYICLKDICRTEEADLAVYEWLQEKPHYSRPLFETLPLSQQTSLVAQYATFNNAAYNFFYNLPEAIMQLLGIEEGNLVNIDTLPEHTQGLARNTSHLFDSALALGLNRAVDTLNETGKPLARPLHENLLRHTPKAMYLQLIDAARLNQVTFKQATPDETKALRHEMSAYVQGLKRLKHLNIQRLQYIYPSGERHPKADEFEQRTRVLRKNLGLYTARFAQAMSPFGEHPNEPDLRGANETVSRIGMRMNLPKAPQLEAEKLMHALRAGYEGTSTLAKVGDGLGLVVFFVQLVNMWQVKEEIRGLSGDPDKIGLLNSSLAATGFAGFSVAQSIMNNAFTSRASQLNAISNKKSIHDIHLRMGKLNLSLGPMTYLFGIWSATISTHTHLKEINQATLSKNTNTFWSAQTSLAGSLGQVGASAYYGNKTITFFMQSFIKSAGQPQRLMEAIRYAGPQLYKSFWRYNITGAFFTALEIIGTWFYNHYNTSLLDEWLLTTAWGTDLTRRASKPLSSYTHQLQHITHTPTAHVLLNDTHKEIHLHLPTLSLALLTSPAASYAHHGLKIGAFDIRKRVNDKGQPIETWTAVSERVCDRLEMLNLSPLQLRVLPVSVGQPTGLEQHSMVLVVQILTLVGKPQKERKYEIQEYDLWIDLHTEGMYRPSKIHYKTQMDALQYIDPLLLSKAHQP